jgi:hypothetical protein
MVWRLASQVSRSSQEARHAVMNVGDPSARIGRERPAGIALQLGKGRTSS